ncbi:MAG: AsmA family protein, partial [Candidatus Eiseniibacteriota bacterium]
MKKILIGVAALVVLVIVAALVIPFFVPTDTYKQQIAEQVKSATGRDLAIKGDIGFSLLPNIELKVNDVAFANAPGAATKDMATFKSLLVQLKLMPLLSGNVEVDSFVLVEPIINLEVDKSGKPNWEFQPAAAKPAEIGKAPTAPAKPSGPPSDPMATLAKLKLGDIRLEKGRVTYADAKSGDKQVLDNVNVTIAFPDIESALAVNGNL